MTVGGAGRLKESDFTFSRNASSRATYRTSEKVRIRARWRVSPFHCRRAADSAFVKLKRVEKFATESALLDGFHHSALLNIEGAIYWVAGFVLQYYSQVNCLARV